MDSRWLKGTRGEVREARKKEVLGYKRALQDLAQLLKDDFEDSSPDYNNSAWPYEQADVNGANRKLQEILNLINIKD